MNKKDVRFVYGLTCVKLENQVRFVKLVEALFCFTLILSKVEKGPFNLCTLPKIGNVLGRLKPLLNFVNLKLNYLTPILSKMEVGPFNLCSLPKIENV